LPNWLDTTTARADNGYMNTKQSALRAMDNGTLVELLRDTDPDSAAYWAVNRELTRREWFWLESDADEA